MSLGASLCSRHPTVGHVCPGSPGDRGTPAIVYLQAIADYNQAWHSLASELAGTPSMSLLALGGAASSVCAISTAPVLLEYSSHQYWFWKRAYRLAAALASRATYSEEAESPQVQSQVSLGLSSQTSFSCCNELSSSGCGGRVPDFYHLSCGPSTLAEEEKL